MNLWVLLAAWTGLSVPVALVIGSVLGGAAERRAVPAPRPLAAHHRHAVHG